MQKDHTDFKQDPLKDLNQLPQWALTCGINHHSPSQGQLINAVWLAKYIMMNQEERRQQPVNAQMKAGVAVNNALQNYYAEIIYRINPLTKKISETKNEKVRTDKQVLIYEEINKFKDYIPNDEKDQAKKDRYSDEILDVCNQAFSALEEIGVASFSVTSERQISINQDRSMLQIPVVGRTDFELSTQTDVIFPSGLIELKTSWSKIGKVKKDGSRSFIVSTAPATPSFNHLMQCAFYSAAYDFKTPIVLLYATKNDYKIFDSKNCEALTTAGLQTNYNKMLQILKRREKILSMSDGASKEEIIKNAVQLIEPNWDHPYLWHGFNEDILERARGYWNNA